MLRKLFTFPDRSLDKMFTEIIRAITHPGQDLKVFDDNAAALDGGLVKHQEYRTPTGQRMVVY